MLRHAPLAFLVSTLVCACAASGQSSANAEAQAQFERMKTLAGEWVTVDGGAGHAPAGDQVRYRVVSNGSVVVEEISPASEHAMVTVYHLDGGALVMTHYCALRNQPHMVASAGSDPSTVSFTCVGGSNFECRRDMHMHAAEFHFEAADRVQATWTARDQGKPCEAMKFALVRRGA